MWWSGSNGVSALNGLWRTGKQIVSDLWADVDQETWACYSPPPTLPQIKIRRIFVVCFVLPVFENSYGIPRPIWTHNLKRTVT